MQAYMHHPSSIICNFTNSNGLKLEFKSFDFSKLYNYSNEVKTKKQEI